MEKAFFFSLSLSLKEKKKERWLCTWLKSVGAVVLDTARLGGSVAVYLR